MVMGLDADQLLFGHPLIGSLPGILAANTQSTSLQRNCGVGIYKKLPGENDLNFCAEEDDIYSTWSCEDLHMDGIFEPDIAPKAVFEELKNTDHIQVGNMTFTAAVNSDSIHATALLGWSLYIDNETATRAPIHVRVSIDMNKTAEDIKTMKYLECNLTSKDPNHLEGMIAVAKHVDYRTLSDWLDGLKAMVFKYARLNAFSIVGADPR